MKSPVQLPAPPPTPPENITSSCIDVGRLVIQSGVLLVISNMIGVHGKVIHTSETILFSQEQSDTASTVISTDVSGSKSSIENVVPD